MTPRDPLIEQPVLRLTALAADAALAVLCYFAAYSLRFDSSDLARFLPGAARTVPFIAVSQIAALLAFRAYTYRQGRRWLPRLLAGICAGTAFGVVAVRLVYGFQGVSRISFAVDALLLALAAGADFRELAREHSDDPLGRKRGGAHAIFLRGPTDAVLKAAVFEADVGDVIGPLESPLGTSLALRVPPEELDPALADDLVARARAILIQEQPGRDYERCEALANELAEKIRAGENMAELARGVDDDPGGRERAGDLGWILRRSSKTWPVLERVFQARPGELVGPLKLSHGFLLLRREA